MCFMRKELIDISEERKTEEKRGRKRLPNEQKMRNQLTIRLTDKELDVLYYNAERMQISPSALIRWLLAERFIVEEE